MKQTKITNKQLEILILLYRYRFLSRIHIQNFLNHKNDTRISSWLKDLTQKELVSRIYTRDLSNQPAVYYLANKSREILKTKDKINPDLLNRVYREKYRSQAFINHCLFIADLYFHFQKAAEKQNSACNFYTATDLTNVAHTPLPLPDVYLVVKNEKDSKRYFLEVLDNKPMFAIRKRVDNYLEYYQENYWQDHNKYPFPKILLICPSVRVKISIQKYIASLLEFEDDGLSFFLGLKDNIDKFGINQNTWENVETSA